MIRLYMKFFHAAMAAELSIMRMERAAGELLRGLNDLHQSRRS